MTTGTQNSKITMFVGVVTGIVLFSIFAFLRAPVSIGIIVIIILYLINIRLGDHFFKVHKSIWFLLFAGLLINISTLFVDIYTYNFNIKHYIGSGNPIIIVAYICALNYFLSKNKNYAKYLLDFLVAIISILAVLSLGVFTYYTCLGQSFIMSDLIIYTIHSGGATIQSMVALTFPLSAVILLKKSSMKSFSINKVLLIILAIIIIFADLFINRSKVGYLIELMVLVYYSFVFIRKYSYQDGKLYLRRILVTISVSALSLGIIFGSAFHFSSIFNARVSQMFSEISIASKNDNISTYNKLAQTSTGLRYMYYSSSVKLFKQYPEVFVFGCGYTTHISNPTDCSRLLIKNNDKLSSDVTVVKDGIEAHNEFINYTFKGGVLAGISLLMFFILLLYESKHIDQYYRNFFRIFVLAFVIGCLFDYFITVQIMVALFSTILGIFLSIGNSDKQIKCD